jgi:tetratricopeptide (TPR) repeat protein
MPYDDKTDFDKMWDYNDPQGTEKKFRQLLPEAEKVKDKGRYIELLTQLARTQSLQKKFTEAHEILDKAMRLINAEHIRPRIRYMLERGRTYNSSGEFEKARELFHAAYMQAEKYNEDNLAIDAVHMLGIVDKGEDSLKWNNLAIEMAEKTPDKNAKGWLGSLYNNTGWTYHDMGEFNKALELFEKNVTWHKDRDTKTEQGIAKWCVARTLRSLDRIEESLKLQTELEEWFREKGIDNTGYNYLELGECLLLLNKSNEAKPWFRKAYEILKDDIWYESADKERLKKLAE